VGRLKIAYLHYHLKRGGVTTVIKHQVDAVSEDCDTLIVSSSLPQHAHDFNTPVHTTPLLAYDKDAPRTFPPRELADAILSAIKEKWPGGCDVLHVHNPTLAKNRHLLKALNILRHRGMRMFLQIHDFAEDGRPGVYSNEDYIANVHYGVINSRDYDILRKAGLKQEGLHIIANKVSPLMPASEQRKPHPGSAGDGPVLYPVRAIRRKNIGEALLLSLFLPKNHAIGITLPPNSPGDRISYCQWKSFIDTHHFNVKLDVGVKDDFSRLVRGAPFFITTSVNEGFGFAFLEPWTAGKMVFGRYLPHVCRDFEKQGLKLEHLYHSFYIPLQAIDSDNRHISFYYRWKEALLTQAAAFHYPLDPASLQSAYNSLTTNRAIDFGVLDEIAQQEALLNIKNHPLLARDVRRLNAWIRFRLEAGADLETIKHNDRIVRSQYSRQRYREQLLNIYRAVTSTHVKHRIQRQKILAAFLDPAQFKMLRWMSANA
jgi:glycosyltransferase involved in cell wall biosynthesis